MMISFFQKFTCRYVFIAPFLLALFVFLGCGGGSDIFDIPNLDPDPDSEPGDVQVTIDEPAPYNTYHDGDEVTFACRANQVDAIIEDDRIRWHSNIDGIIGTGRSFSLQTLSEGIHRITVTAASDIGDGGSDRVHISIVGERAVLKTIFVGENPAYLAISPDGEFAYVPNYADDTVSVIQTSDHSIIQTVEVGSGPMAVEFSPDGNYAYVNNRDDGSVSVLDTSDHVVVHTIPVGALPWGITIDPDGQYVYTSNSHRDNVSVIQTDTHTVVDTVADHPDRRDTDSFTIYYYDIITSKDSQYLYVNTLVHPFFRPNDPQPHGPGEVMVVRTADYSIVDRIFVGDLSVCLATSPDGNYLYTTIANDNAVAVIQTSDNSVTTTFAVGETPDDIIVTPDGAHIFVVNNNDNSLLKIQSSDFTILNTIAVGNHPRGVAATPDQEYIYVTNYDDGTVFVIDASQL